MMMYVNYVQISGYMVRLAKYLCDGSHAAICFNDDSLLQMYYPMLRV